MRRRIRPHQVRDIDQASYALIRDLKQRGMLDDTLAIHGPNAPTLHCLGIDHEKLTAKFQGLGVKLTGVE